MESPSSSPLLLKCTGLHLTSLPPAYSPRTLALITTLVMSRTAQMMNFTGRILDCGRYELLQVLGTGAYGVVYRANDLKTAASAGSPVPVAIKILDKRHFDGPAAERVRREVVLHHVVNEHPNVVSMRHTFEDTMFVYIVMDYCPGGDLFTRISDDKMFFRNDDLVKSVFLKIVDAVAFCHEKRVYHRDLKPDNILCSKDGSQVYVSDFGLCTSGLVSTTWGCGSAPYMSPECVGKDAGYLPYSNQTSDIWSLGVILVNMISSRTPWQKAITSDDCFCDFLLNEDYLLRMLPISEEVNALLRKLFTYEPSERIDLDTLRSEIIAIPTFFMNDEELARAGDSVRSVAASLGVHVKPAKGAQTAKKSVVIHSIPIRQPRGPPPRCDDLPVPSLDITDANSSSPMSSMGPVTPGSDAAQRETFLPELQKQLEGVELAGLTKDEKMPRAPRFRLFARALAASVPVPASR